MIGQLANEHRERASSNVLERILVLVRGKREGELTVELLRRGGFTGFLCADIAAVCASMVEGAGAILLAEELLNDACIGELRKVLDRQPPWSDFPIVIFSAPEEGREAAKESVGRLGNVTFLDRPVHVRTMLASIHAAVDSRRRQYEARRAIESRDDFLAMLGHELRNPLGAITFAIALLQKKTPEAAVLHEHAVIERQARHLTRLVDDLLDVARFTHGKVELKRTRIDLVEVIRAAFETLEGRARENRLSYALHLEAPEVPVEGDQQRLEQAFSNLISNAIKYTPPGGEVNVEVWRGNDVVHVAVVDNGVGIEPSMQGRVFDPFAQVDSSLDRAQGGLGLGLALVRSIVTMHGGTVDVASGGLGRGSSFNVTLPRLKSGLSLPPSPMFRRRTMTTKKKIVIVEDTKDLRDLLAELLATHDVVAAEDGPSGLDKILTFKPEIAFVDLGLPGFDGLELARRARLSGFGGRLIALTGYGQADDRSRALAAGFDDHLVKPVVCSEITDAILRADSSPANA